MMRRVVFFPGGLPKGAPLWYRWYGCHGYRRSRRVTTWRNFKVFVKTLKFLVPLILEGSLPDLHAASQPVSRPPLYITILKYAYHRYHHTTAHFSSVKRVKMSRKSDTRSKHQRYHLYRRSCRVTTWRKNFKVFDKTLKFFVTLILEGSLPDLRAASQPASRLSASRRIIPMTGQSLE